MKEKVYVHPNPNNECCHHLLETITVFRLEGILYRVWNCAKCNYNRAYPLVRNGIHVEMGRRRKVSDYTKKKKEKKS